MKRFALLAAVLGVAIAVAGCGSADPIGVGTTPPTFTVEGLNTGDKVTSDSLKGRVVIVDFWATWCGPCRMEMPEVERIWKDYKDRGVELMAVSNESKDTLANFQKVEKPDAPIYVDADGAVNHLLGITGFPTTIVLGKDGRIIYTSVGYSYSVPREIEDAIKKALS